jgi:hypothetical protein
VEMLTGLAILPSGTVAWSSALLNLIVVILSRRMVLQHAVRDEGQY